MNSSQKRIAIVGAGLGGLSAAIHLAAEGFAVDIFEKNHQIGGKLNCLKTQGYSFDLGPSILTLPQHFETLFRLHGKVMANYFTIRPLRPHWRNFFEDGTSLDLVPEPDEMARQLARIGESPEELHSFLDYAGHLYDLVDSGYFQQGLDSVRDFQRHYGLWQFRQFDLLRTMHGGVARHVRSPYLRDILDFFIKYVGSSAYDAPAFMNCLPTIQFRHDLWYVDGGMYGIATGLERLAAEAGIRIHTNRAVTQIPVGPDGQVTGVNTADGMFHPANIVISNLEVIPAYRTLLAKDEAFLRRFRRFAPACSGLVLDLGLDTVYPQLAHHNFFYSGNQRAHFNSVFRRFKIPHDPTLYVVAAARTDSTVAPPGCDSLKILPHIPPLNPEHPVDLGEYQALRDRILEKLERMGLTDLRRHIVVEHLWTPYDIEAQYGSNQGSIYGVVTNRYKNFGFKAPKQSDAHPNLFFVGGSVNPGGGMPMVILCGQNVGRQVTEWLRKS